MDKRPHVLIVDDEKRLAQGIAKLLNSRGIEALAVFSGRQALEAIKTGNEFDVVVLDVKMPGMTGIDSLVEIKKLAPGTEVIMLTGHASLDSGTQAMRCGAYDYLMKPCDIENLVEKINEAYEVESIKRRPVLWQRNLVKDLTLYSFKKLKLDDPLKEALDIFSRETRNMVVEEVYIQDRDNRFRGTVTKRDLIVATEEAHPGRSFTWPDLMNNPDLLPQKPLKSVMHTVPPLTTTPDEPLTDVAHRMLQDNVRCMPVIEMGKVIGIVRLQDIFRFVDHETE
ncbi:MAG: response regulator [Desulfobacterales bacterium]|nr:response regulator [Desulfobacterales bacterium]